MSKHERTPAHVRAAEFAATRWTLVLAAAGGRIAPRAEEAMAELCRSYWYPIYAFIRRQGHDAHEAEDLTQEFFARLLAKHFLAGVDRARGRFRTFLQMAVKRFLANEYDRSQAQKRGGGQTIVSFESLDAEARYRQEPAHTLTAERLFERQWALTLLERVLARLEVEWASSGKAALFDALKGCLAAGRTESYAAIATNLGITEGAVKVAAHRLRRRYRNLLREEIAHTVTGPEEIEDEIRYLLGCL
jgi:RNA polymerase sigma factor (sigma-70 family)